MKKFVSLICAITTGMSLLTGCVVKSDAMATVINEKELNVYTALEDDQINEYLEGFKDQYPNVQVNITRDSTGIITSKLLAEKDNPIADVVWGLSATSLLVLEEEGLLASYEPKGIERILPKFKDTAVPPKWVGIDAWETAVIVNKEVLKNRGIDTVPQSYADLLDPKYKGLIAMSNPASSGTGLLTVNGVLQLYGEEQGWSYLDQLHENVGVYLHSGSQPAKLTATGEYGIGISFGYRCIKSANDVGSEIAEVVFPEEGSGWDLEANALIQKEGMKVISKTFLDWAIGDEVMTQYAQNYPIIAIERTEEWPEGYNGDPIEQLIEKNDFQWAAKNRERILNEWSQRYDGKSAPKN